MRAPLVLTVLLLLGAISRLPGQPDSAVGDQYLKGYLLKNEAERLERKGDLKSATEKYNQASQIIADLAQNYPSWQPEVVGYRLRAIDAALQRLASKSGQPSAVDPSSTTDPSVKPAVTLETLKMELQEQKKILDELRSQVEHLKHGPNSSSDPSK